MSDYIKREDALATLCTLKSCVLMLADKVDDFAGLVKELPAAESTACTVQLPFPVGTEVWSAEPFTDGKPRKGRVVGFEVSEKGCDTFWVSFSQEAVSAAFLVRWIGQMVFLSREEAEEAWNRRM